jgi:hypothetical protein
MSDIIDEAWGKPPEELVDEKKPKLPYKELLRQFELLEKQNLQQDIELDASRKRAVQLSTELVATTERLEKTGAELTACAYALRKSEDEALRLRTENATGGQDRVVYKGKIHKIVRVNTCKWLALEDFRKRFVEEDDTVVVIDRKGV